MHSIPYFFLDVFTQQPFGGNQLMVFLDLEDQLSKETMLAMAREAKLAEIAFIKADLGPGHYRARIFTPEYEVPFAGHPSLGTAYVIHQHLSREALSSLVLELPHGNIPIDISPAEKPGSFRYTMEQAQPAFGRTFTGKDICTGLTIDPIGVDFNYESQVVSTGLPYIIIMLRDLEALNQLQLSTERVTGWLKARGQHKSNSATGLTTSLYCVTTETEDPNHHYQGRMFCLENGVLVEDAATGSANGCFLAYLLKHGTAMENVIVEQGYAMGRKSLLLLDGKVENGHYTLKVGGQVVEMGSGTWRV